MLNLQKHNYEELLYCTILIQKGQKWSLANLFIPHQSCQGTAAQESGSSPQALEQGIAAFSISRQASSPNLGETTTDSNVSFSFSIICILWRALLQLPCDSSALCLLRENCTNTLQPERIKQVMLELGLEKWFRPTESYVMTQS